MWNHLASSFLDAERWWGAGDTVVPLLATTFLYTEDQPMQAQVETLLKISIYIYDLYAQYKEPHAESLHTNICITPPYEKISHCSVIYINVNVLHFNISL
jgi:hypothetical protein